MGQMILAVTGIVAVLVILQAIWQILLGGLAIFAAACAAAGIFNYANRKFDARRQYHAAIAARADRQHKQIMSGDTINGTYGDYLPPMELR